MNENVDVVGRPSMMEDDGGDLIDQEGARKEEEERQNKR